jgi:hypothetical protein
MPLRDRGTDGVIELQGGRLVRRRSPSEINTSSDAETFGVEERGEKLVHAETTRQAALSDLEALRC